MKSQLAKYAKLACVGLTGALALSVMAEEKTAAPAPAAPAAEVKAPEAKAPEVKGPTAIMPGSRPAGMPGGMPGGMPAVNDHQQELAKELRKVNFGIWQAENKLKQDAAFKKTMDELDAKYAELQAEKRKKLAAASPELDSMYKKRDDLQAEMKKNAESMPAPRVSMPMTMPKGPGPQLPDTAKVGVVVPPPPAPAPAAAPKDAK